MKLLLSRGIVSDNFARPIWTLHRCKISYILFIILSTLNFILDSETIFYKPIYENP